MSEELRMDAYYYSFEKTGVPEIDRILSAVACAGKAYHGTDQWNDDAFARPGHVGATPVDWIQNAAIDAAKALSRPAPAVQVPEGASVSTDVEYMRVNGMFELSVCVTFPPMTDADANAYGYSQRDALAKSLRPMLAAATPATVATEPVAQGVVANAPCGGVELACTNPALLGWDDARRVAKALTEEGYVMRHELEEVVRCIAKVNKGDQP